MVYDNRHRTFLQSIMQHGVMLDQEATVLCVKIFDQRIKVSQVAALINDKLAPLAMSMKVGICELTGDKYWSVVGTTHEEDVMIPSEFTPAQKAFLMTIYSEIINSPDGCIPSTSCLNLTHNISGHKLSISDANEFLKNVVKKMYLHLKDGYYYMGVRSIVELMPYFRATYLDNFDNCNLCREIIFHGYKCNNCDKGFHNYCLARYLSRKNDNNCPNCNNQLNIDDMPEEVVASQKAKENQDEEEEKAEEADEPMDVSDEDEVKPPPKRVKRKSRIH